VAKRLLLALAVFVSAALLAGLGYWWFVGEGPELDNGTTGAATTAGKVVFYEDVTPQSGIRFTYHNGDEADHYAILESLGGGVALLDYDGDGLLDIFLTGGGHFDMTAAEYEAALKKDAHTQPKILAYSCKLYRNLGGFHFQDVTREVGLDKIDFYTHGAAVADYDRDGWPDLLVTGYGRVALFKNVADANGRRRFQEVTQEVGLAGPKAGALSQHFWATSAGWADLDGDGYPDLYLCQYVNWSWDNNPPCEGYTAAIPRDVCPPRQFDARPHALYRNNAGRSFTDVSKEAGLRTVRKPADYDSLTHLDSEARERLRQGDREGDFGKGLGVVLVDLDGDGRPEIYVANDTTDKFLYRNRSRPGKVRLEEVAVPVGVATDDRGLPNGSMGVDAGDYDGSGRPSLLVTNYENELHGLYRNLSAKGRLAFEYSSQHAGIANLGRHYVGFGTGFLDLDNDGWLDVVIANGHVIRHPTVSPVRQRPLLLHNEGGQRGTKMVRLTNVTAKGGSYFQTDHQGRGVAIGDLDNDGRPDLVISHLNEPVAVLRNVAGTGHHWLGVELAGKDHADVVGARLTLEGAGRTLTRFARGGGSYLSSADRRHVFGLGNADQVGRLTVVWPDGTAQHWNGLAVDRYWRLTAGMDEARELPRAPAAVR
jgi:hypothetical protein